MEEPESSFDDLLGEQLTEETPTASRRLWVPIASASCVLLGIAAILGSTLSFPSFGTATLDSPASQAQTAVPAGGTLEISGPAPAAARADRKPDPEWVADMARRTEIPAPALTAYANAAQRVRLEHPSCRLGWNTLAGIGLVESAHGSLEGSSIDADGRVTPEIVGIPLDGSRSDAIPDTDNGELDHDSIWDRAVGPMQFIPNTWAHFAADGDGDGTADPHNITDAAYTAARYLCHTGNDLTDPDGWIAAIASYNSSLDYNHRVAEAADRYAALAETIG